MEKMGEYEAADRILGAVLIICTVLGIYGNALSLVYFKKEGGPQLFWHRTYSLLSGVDLLICMAQIPVIQSLIVGRTRPSLVLQDSAICSTWGATWAVIQPISVYIVLFLATSRLLVLLTPQRKPDVKLPFRCMWIGVLLLLAATIGPASTRLFSIGYDVERVHCFLEPIGETLVISHESFGLVRAVFLAVPFLPLLAVATMSGVMLRRASKQTFVTPTIKNNRFASKTILIVSIISLVCNVSTVCCAMYLALVYSPNNVRETTPGTITPRYIEFISQDVMTAINSTLHPAVFLFRMKPFRQYVSEWGNPRTSLATGLSQMSLSARRSSLVTRLSEVGGSISSRISTFSRSSIRPMDVQQQLTVLSEEEENDVVFQGSNNLVKDNNVQMEDSISQEDKVANGEKDICLLGKKDSI